MKKSPTRRPSDGTAPTPAQGDRIELMQTFVRIVEAGTLTLAAAQLGVAQPTITRRLQTLEQSLGVRLLLRSNHATRLTEDGERCYERAKELLTTWAMFEADLRGAGDEPVGVLRVIAPQIFGQEKLIGPLTDYLVRYPHVNVEWLLHSGKSIHNFVADGIDCAIQVGEVNAPDLVCVKLAEVPRIVVAAPAMLKAAATFEHPSSLADLQWIALRNYYGNEVALKHIDSDETFRLPIVPRLTTDNLNALRSAVLRGLGIGIGSTWLLADDLAAGNLVPLCPQWRATPLPVYLVYPYARHYPARLRRFVDIMRTSVPAALAAVNDIDIQRTDARVDR